MPLWHEGYFELKAIKNQQTKENLTDFSFNYLQEFRLEAWHRKRAITGGNFIWKTYLHGRADF